VGAQRFYGRARVRSRLTAFEAGSSSLLADHVTIGLGLFVLRSKQGNW